MERQAFEIFVGLPLLKLEATVGELPLKHFLGSLLSRLKELFSRFAFDTMLFVRESMRKGFPRLRMHHAFHEGVFPS